MQDSTETFLVQVLERRRLHIGIQSRRISARTAVVATASFSECDLLADPLCTVMHLLAMEDKEANERLSGE